MEATYFQCFVCLQIKMLNTYAVKDMAKRIAEIIFQKRGYSLTCIGDCIPREGHMKPSVSFAGQRYSTR